MDGMTINHILSIDHGSSEDDIETLSEMREDVGIVEVQFFVSETEGFDGADRDTMGISLGYFFWDIIGIGHTKYNQCNSGIWSG